MGIRTDNGRVKQVEFKAKSYPKVTPWNRNRPIKKENLQEKIEKEEVKENNSASR